MPSLISRLISVENQEPLLLKKTTVGNCGVWGAEGKRVRTFTNDRHAKKKTGDHLTKKKKIRLQVIHTHLKKVDDGHKLKIWV